MTSFYLVLDLNVAVITDGLGYFAKGEQQLAHGVKLLTCYE